MSHFIFKTVGALLAATALHAHAHAHALKIVSVSPQGEVAQVRQVVAKFDGPAVAFGDPKAPAPMTVRCNDPRSSQGSSRWTSDREWLFEFDSDLPAGVQCQVHAVAGFKSPKGETLPAGTVYKFNTGGPFVKNVRPNSYDKIDEEQYFILELNGPATLASVQKNVSCSVSDLGESLPVRLIDGKERAQLLSANYLTDAAAADPLRFVTLSCNRRFTSDADVELVFGKGVSTPSGVPNTVAKRFSFKVRAPFEASFNCERENAQAACLPIRPMRLSFNAPVERKLAKAIRLSGGGKTYQPNFDDHEGDDLVEAVVFKEFFSEKTNFKIELPRGFQDISGRTLVNADSFPLATATGDMPPLAKFSASPFGIVERFGEVSPKNAKAGEPALLPVTLRNVEASLKIKSLQPGQVGKVSNLQLKDDADIIAWFQRVKQYDQYNIERKQAAKDSKQPLPPVIGTEGKDYVQTRMVSLLQGRANVKSLDLPQPASQDPRPFEVVGIPLSPGFHVVEIASKKLGSSLLDERYGQARTMYVRTSALVTNLGVHFKLGRENSLAWVTSLDTGAPVAGAKVRVSSCRGEELATATTNAQGIAYIQSLSPEPVRCGDLEQSGTYFVSARALSEGVQDMAFTWSDWNRGVEPWRFNVPTSQNAMPDERAHTILDRTLFRAGETVSMKHIIRTENSKGFGLVGHPPGHLVITHVGSGQRFTQALAWRKTATGGQSAENTFAIPVAAKLGTYNVELRVDSEEEYSQGNHYTGSFRVEEFRLPVMEGRIHPSDKKPLVNVRSVPTELQINYVSGGPAVSLPVRVSALVRKKSVSFADYDMFTFSPPRAARQETAAHEEDEDNEEQASGENQRVIMDKQALTLSRAGAGKLTIDNVPASNAPQELLMEATYADPNGEIQTLRSVSTVWPASVIAGIKTEGWVSSGKKIRFQALALDLSGKPAANVDMEVKAVARIVTTSRKRLVGGFYTYDNKTEVKALGTVCTGKSDSRGLVLCEATLSDPGEVELVVSAKDKEGKSVQAAGSVYVTRQGEMWFGGQDHDRMDVLPEKKTYQPGETAKFQVRMPFRYATALVAIEREGILETQVVQLNGQDPTISLEVKEGWGPNVYVSVLALRGRLRDVPWYSFFTWGYKAPREWWTSFWYEGREYVAPTALVDLSKPAFRLGLAEIRVGSKKHELNVTVQADKATYPVRSSANVTIQVKLPNGQPAAHAEVALAAVDQALLELMPNDSWDLLGAMLQRRAWGVETSTAQMEIIGRRHYGRKAVAAGGGGGRSNTRELFDTLLLWNPKVMLDAQGKATLKVPLNDSLTTFKIVAIADAGTGLFGSGQTSIQATQDLQIISGLPPLVREDDQFRAQITLRNTTQAAMKVQVTPRATMLTLPAQTVDIPAGESREVAWQVTAPAQLAFSRAEAIAWEIDAKDTLNGAQDALKTSQRIVPAVPLTVQQATLVQVDGSFSLDVKPPVDALPGRGGLRMSVQPKLAEGMDGVRNWFVNYPYTCLEQQTSKAVGLRDAEYWQRLVAQLPTYLDNDGLANYFPPRDGDSARGSDTLTAYLLAASHEASSLNPAFALSAETRAPLEQGLIGFVEGRLKRDFWSPRQDLDVRKIAALEALSRYGKAQGRMVGSITIAPNQWPTHAVLDWVNVLKRVADVPQRDARLAEAMQVLRSRLSYQGTKVFFSTEKDDYWWWLMANGDLNTARLILTVMDDPAWQEDMGRLANGFIARQQNGAWHTTTANLWGGLALEKFSNKFEATAVSGVTRASLAAAASHTAAVDWSKVERIKSSAASGAAHQNSFFGAPAAPGNLRNNTMFLPWGSAGADRLTVVHQGSGKPWLTLQSVAAVALKAPFNAGYQIKKTITPIEQAAKGVYTRGDVLRVTLEINASADMTWVAISDPIPGGATILGGGLGRDSEIATQGEQKSGKGWLAYEERSFEAFRSYYEYLPKGVVTMEYTVRLNNVGDFALPPSRVEALYAPEMFGEAPNARVKVQAAK